MNELKYQITQIIFLVLLGLGAYWALTSLDSGVQYSRESIVETQEEATPIADEQVNAVNNETVLTVDETPSEESTETEPEPEPEQESSANEDLIAALEELIDDNVTMDSGAGGSRVGTVQEFLDFYFEDRTVSIDNDFGPTTKGLVREFQQAELNGGDGRVGPNTLRAMVEYLEAS